MVQLAGIDLHHPLRRGARLMKHSGPGTRKIQTEPRPKLVKEEPPLAVAFRITRLIHLLTAYPVGRAGCAYKSAPYHWPNWQAPIY